MTTIPTQNAVPSEAPRDLKFNSGKIDEFVTSLEHEYKDRFGRSHLTIEGIKWMFDQLVERFKVDMNQAIIAAGYIPMDSFQLGAEITKRNEILRDETTGEYYRWDGDLPKSVPAGSTPESVGGVGVGKWVGVGDASLRSELRGEDGGDLIYSDNGQTLKDFISAKKIVNTIDDIAFMKLTVRDYIYISNYSESCPVGGGVFKVVKKDEITDDGGINFIRGNNAITRIFDKKINVSFFGVYGDLPTNTESFQRAVDFAGSKYPLVIDGVYELSGTVEIPDNASVSGLDYTNSVVYGNYKSWNGINLDYYQGKSLIIFKTGVLLKCNEGVKLENFDIVARLSDKAIGKEINGAFASDPSMFNKTTAIVKNKYIKINRVSITFAEIAIRDQEFNGSKGDYYTVTNGLIINNCNQGMVYDNPSYNNKHFSIRITNVGQPFECYKEANNWVFYGGAIEGYTKGSVFPGRSDLSFFGTYFEASTVEVDHIFYITDSAQISFHDCLMYLSYTKSVVRTSAAQPVSVNVFNSRFIMISGPTKESSLLNVNDNNGIASLTSVNNKYMPDSGFRIKDVLFEIKNIFGHDNYNNFRMGSTDGITMKILSSPPVDGRSGTMYCCDGSSWNPASKPGGLPYFVFYRDGVYIPMYAPQV